MGTATMDEEELLHEEVIKKTFEIATFNTKEHCIRGRKYSVIPNIGHYLEHPTEELLKIIHNDLKNYLEYREYYNKETIPDNLAVASEKIKPVVENIEKIANSPSKSIYTLDKFEIPIEKPKIETMNNNNNNEIDYQNESIEDLLKKVQEEGTEMEEKKENPTEPEEEKTIVKGVVDTAANIKEIVEEAVSEVVESAEEAISETVEDVLEDSFGKEKEEELCPICNKPDHSAETKHYVNDDGIELCTICNKPNHSAEWKHEEPILTPAPAKWINEPEEYQPGQTDPFKISKLQEELEKENPIIKKVEEIKEKLFPKKSEKTEFDDL